VRVGVEMSAKKMPASIETQDLGFIDLGGNKDGGNKQRIR
jgi:hypothetical protein